MRPTRTRVARRALGAAFLAMLAVVPCACDPVTPQPAAVASGEVHEFEGSWNAAGSRRAIPLGAGRNASIIELRGTMLLAGAGRPGVGFRSDVVALSDSATGLVGRSVWTDERGDQVYSELAGEGTAAHNHVAGKIVGGTGRYADATGSYDFSWEFVIETGEGAIQGRAVGLKGHVARGAPAVPGARQ